MTLNSISNELKLSDQNLFYKLTDINNYEKIMPENISKFEIIDEYTFVFSLNGMPSIKLKIDENRKKIKIFKLL